MKKIFFLFLFVVLFQQSWAQIPTTEKGKIDFYPAFKSRLIPSVDIAVWIPSNFQSSKKYRVLYLQDGAALFDAKITWNQQEWGVDECIDSLIAADKIDNVIVVGIYNSGNKRHASYFPQLPFEQLNKQNQAFILNAKRSKDQLLFNAPIYSDNYLKFITKELKPFIDKNYPTLKDPKHTAIGGSSMGGLISLYAICEYPKIFGAAMCLSTHWPGIFESEQNPFPIAYQQYLIKKLPNPNTHQIYFDYGTATLDAIYEPYQMRINEIMKLKGFSSSNFKSNKYEGAEHNENAWKARLNDPILFLFKKPKQ